MKYGVVLVIGFSFQGRHYDLGGSATAPKYCQSYGGRSSPSDFLLAWSSVPFQGCLEISFSIDAVDSDLYKYIRRGGNIEKVTSNIKHLNKLKLEF